VPLHAIIIPGHADFAKLADLRARLFAAHEHPPEAESNVVADI
jgi:hypothetical protein